MTVREDAQRALEVEQAKLIAQGLTRQMLEQRFMDERLSRTERYDIGRTLRFLEGIRVVAIG